jgi:NADPH:quinone reductase-like Zn-dependent oxidoreductase
MIAIVQTRYMLRNPRIMDVPESVLGETQVVVRVNAAALNYAVMFRVTGTHGNAVTGHSPEKQHSRRLSSSARNGTRLRHS